MGVRKFFAKATCVVILVAQAGRASGAEPENEWHQEFQKASCYDATDYLEIYSDRSWSERFQQYPIDTYKVAAHACMNDSEVSIIHVQFRTYDFAISLRSLLGAKLYIRILDDRSPVIALAYGFEEYDELGNMFVNYVFDLQSSRYLGTLESPEIIRVDEIRNLVSGN